MNTQQLQTDKLNIINWVSQLQDASLLDKIKILMNTSKECLLSNDQKKAIDDALLSIENKGVFSHNIVMEETKKRFPHLYNR